MLSKVNKVEMSAESYTLLEACCYADYHADQFVKDGRQETGSQKGQQNILMSPYWPAAVQLINSSPSVLADGKEGSDNCLSQMVSVISGLIII